ncbi:NAD(P)/FAD-dependent oxidoreductase [Inquilinus sp. CA228]|uniref:NAD(P)/FAD-dependent oxidoreductase n=1 Tax=Inquilinus sp. CA228 TaxID=3455609 RepID=UPI003F8D2270
MTVTQRIDTDVAIIGGGIAGAAAALALRRIGMSVLLLERGFCGAQASGVNYGGVRRQGRPPEQIPLSQRAHAIWQRLPETIGIDGEYIRSGHLKLARSEAELASLEAYQGRVRDLGLGLEIVAGNAFRARWPWLGDRALAGSWCPDDGHANPRLVSPGFARAARKAGADIREQTAVQEAVRDGDGFRLLAGDGLEIRSRLLLNCAGAWSGRFATAFGETVPLESAHPNMAVTEPLPRLMDINVGVEGGSVYARQVERGNCVMGGGRGIGLDADRARPGRSAIGALLRQAAELFPALRGAQVIRFWSGIEGDTPDRNPVLGPSRTTPGLIHGFGFSGAGFQIGPAVGEVLAELARDGRSTTPIEAFDIGRFAGTAA